jgi:phosphoenolpyruvate-protein kinase (PTS system EI component)
MISSLAEFRQVRAFLEQAHSQLLEAGIPCAPRPQLGVLIEVPAAAIIADALAQEADFISIGTNDLVQYVLACDRTSQRVAQLYQPLAPAVLRLIAMITDAAHRHGRLVSICGEMASDPALTALLIGLGIDELSCAPAALPRLRSAVRATDAAAARQQARAALSAGSLDEVRAILRTDAPQ